MPKFRYFPICFARRTSEWVKEFGSQGTMLSSTLTDKPCSINCSWCGRGMRELFFVHFCLQWLQCPRIGLRGMFYGFTVLPLQEQKCNILAHAAFWIDFHRSTMRWSCMEATLIEAAWKLPQRSFHAWASNFFFFFLGSTIELQCIFWNRLLTKKKKEKKRKKRKKEATSTSIR